MLGSTQCLAENRVDLIPAAAVWCSDGIKRFALLVKALTQHQYEALAAFRLELRRYLSFAQDAAANCGITMQQHQAILAIRASAERALSIGELAELLFLRHHSAVELTDRLVKAGLVERSKTSDDGRKTLISLTELGATTLNELAISHLAEIQHHGPELAKSLSRVISARSRVAAVRKP
jgi:DNA-binding MarR family transcriptional regulator